MAADPLSANPVSADRLADPAGSGARRRRGPALEDAICQAAFSELIEVGYGAFTVEGVAARAQTGKASIYRRWPTKEQLLIDAFCRCAPATDQADGRIDDAVCTREALRRLMRSHLANKVEQEIAAIQALASEAARDPHLADTIDRELLAPRREQFRAILARGVQRGEIAPDAPIDLVAEVIPALVITRVLFRHRLPDAAMIDELVDLVAWPMLGPAGQKRPEKSNAATCESVATPSS